MQSFAGNSQCHNEKVDWSAWAFLCVTATWLFFVVCLIAAFFCRAKAATTSCNIHVLTRLPHEPHTAQLSLHTALHNNTRHSAIAGCLCCPNNICSSGFSLRTTVGKRQCFIRLHESSVTARCQSMWQRSRPSHFLRLEKTC